MARIAEPARPEAARSAQRPWAKRRNWLGVRNGEFLLIVAAALIVGVAATFITAYIGIR